MKSSIFLGLIALCLVPDASAHADTLQVTEYRVTASSAYETTPTLGNDGTTDLVVFTVRPLVGGVPGAGDIWFQELASDGTPSGLPIQVTNGPIDEELNDVSGDYIVYTAHDSVYSHQGAIIAYRISTAETHQLARADIIQEPRIHGDTVVWHEGAAGAWMVMRFRLSWLGTGRDADIIAGPVPPTTDIQIGSRFAVWSEPSGGQYDVYAFDLAFEIETRLTNTADLDEREPATTGAWIVWKTTQIGTATSSIVARNLDTAELVTIADNSTVNANPSADGDFVAWESDAAGNFDVWLYRISTREAFQITTDPSDQYLNDVFGNKIAYVDARGGSEDIWVSAFTFVNHRPVADAGDNQVLTRVGTLVTLDGTQSNDEEADPLTYSWRLLRRPYGSSAALNDPSAAQPTFVADVNGEYEAQLVVNDGYADSEPDVVLVSFANVPPVANAGGHQSVTVGDMVTLAGSGTDANGDPLTYQWALESRPAGSGAVLMNATSPTALFIADVAGTYTVSLVVHDGIVGSEPDTVNILATHTPSQAITAIQAAIEAINALPAAVLKNRNVAKPLTSKLSAVASMLEAGEFQEASEKLAFDVLKKTDGCTAGGAPDANDWITACDAQAQIYLSILAAIQMISEL